MAYTDALKTNKKQTNSEAIEQTYYEYHGKYEDGESAVVLSEKLRGVVIA